MKLDLAASAARDLHFAFAGGSNIPESGSHMHDGRIRLIDADHIEARWTSYKGATAEGAHTFALVRQK
jgi:hypothetical protein